MNFLKILFVFFNDTSNKNEKKIDVGTGAPQQREEVYWG